MWLEGNGLESPFSVRRRGSFVLSTLDFTIIGVYVVVSIISGIAMRGRQEGSDDYFTAHGQLAGPFQSILIGLSITATFFSGVSFLALPGLAFREGWGFLCVIPGLVVCLWIARSWFLPTYLSFRNIGPYDFIETQLGKQVRLLAAVLFILLRFSWLAVLIYAPMILLRETFDLEGASFYFVLAAIGLVCTVYTVFGGIRGVIVTSALQMLLVFASMFAVVCAILWRLPVSLPETVSLLQAEGALRLPGFSLDPEKVITIWTLTIGMGINYAAMFFADQMSLQRYLVDETPQSAARSFTLNIAGTIVVLILLFAIGLLLKAWFLAVPDANMPVDSDRVLPYFVVNYLPPGLPGLLVAGILAATMDSITSGINTLAAVITLDFRARFGKPMDAQAGLRFSRWTSAVVGIFATGAALMVGQLGSLFDVGQRVLGVVMGPIFGIVLLAMFAIRVPTVAVFVATFAGCAGGIACILVGFASVWTGCVSMGIFLLLALAANLASAKKLA